MAATGSLPEWQLFPESAAIMPSRHTKKGPAPVLTRGPFLLVPDAYTTPNASIASATFLKPAMFAPFT